MKKILTGLKPSGELTLGSLIGAISQTVKIQDEYDSFIFVPDMHAITVKQEPQILKERIKVKFKDGEETFFKRYDLKDVKVIKRARKEEELDAETQEDLKELKIKGLKKLE